MLARIIAPAVLSALTACAAVPGYQPPPLIEKKSTFGQALESGDVQGGRYEMSASEKSMDCKRLKGSMQITISRLKDPSGREEPSAIASTAQQWTSPLYGGSGRGADRQALYARERAKLDAYNEELAAKGCKTLDVETELARAPDPPGKKY
jgi:hypothetical protein